MGKIMLNISAAISFALIAGFVAGNAYGIGLTNGIAVNDTTVMNLAANSDEYADIRIGLRDAGVFEIASLDAYANPDGSRIYYALLSDITLHKLNLATNLYLGGWTLQPYKAEALEPGLLAEYDQYKIDVQYKHFQTHGDLGCLSEHPLRYSDLDNDGSQELILFLSDSRQLDWVVFSTNTNASIFSSRLIHQLSYMGISATPDELKDLWPNYGKPDDFQYPSRYAGDRVPVMAVGTNSYAKLYFGDFDNDGRFDIIVWRKLYQSKKMSDPVKGFELKEQLWTHYSLDGGNYKKQSTPTPTIQDWLTTNNLTWQKGYPSQSECAGEEGQLIKEMHDPLLNDADVLQ